MFISNKNHLQTVLFLVTIILNVCYSESSSQHRQQGREKSVQTTNHPQSEQLRLNNIQFGQGKPNVGQGLGQQPETQAPQHEPSGHIPENNSHNSFVLPPRNGFGFAHNYPNGNNFGFQHQPFAGGFYPMMGLNPYFG